MKIVPRILFALLCTAAILNAQKKSPPELRDGASFSANGTLRLVHRGYSAYLVLETGRIYIAAFDGNDRRQTSAIELSLSGNWDVLKLHAGEHMTAEGVLELEPNSPYYYNGVALRATTVHLANGQTLAALRQSHPDQPSVLPEGATSYFAQISFYPRSASYSYLAWTSDWKSLPQVENLLSCRLNGSGELLNCFCQIEGFEVTKTGRIRNGRFVRDRVDEIPQSGAAIHMPDFAQFSLPETIPPKIERAVLCTHSVPVR